jgi:ubiquinone/menaquinone biosynthesis C-methylase UbiE
MRRFNRPEILDSDGCPPEEVEASLRDMSAINHRFGGIATTYALIERVAAKTGKKRFSLLDVAAGFGEVPRVARDQLAQKEISVDVTLLDSKLSHLLPGNHSVVGQALLLPFADNSFDLVSCSLFAHHLQPDELAGFAREASRVGRFALLINDLVRSPLHLALVYAAFPLMRSYVSRYDGVVSVRRSYIPDEIRQIVRSAFPGDSVARVEIFRRFLFRMGVIVWK